MSDLFLFVLALLGGGADANYRHYHVDNADICNTGTNFKIPGLTSSSSKADPDSKRLDIGTGAAIFQLQSPSISFQPNYHNKAKRCEIHVRAPENYGLTAYIEEMHMRKNVNDNKCVDYIQFGENDMIPFVTFKKSERLCGELWGRDRVDKGFTYNDVHGNLLIWVSLGGRRQSNSWPMISSVNLTVVVTAYQKSCRKPKKNFRRCGSGNMCIWKHYNCDKHFNCPLDVIPADEDSCPVEGAEDTTLGPGHGDGTSDGELNIVSFTLIIVASSLIFLLSLVLVCRCRKKRRCCGGSRDQSSCELPENQGPRSISELSRQRHLRETEENVYLPLNTFHQSSSPNTVGQILQEESRQRAGGGQSYHRRNSDDTVGAIVPVSRGSRGSRRGHQLPPEEPPPAYDDLFPVPGEEHIYNDLRAEITQSSQPQEHQPVAAVAASSIPPPRAEPSYEDELHLSGESGQESGEEEISGLADASQITELNDSTNTTA